MAAKRDPRLVSLGYGKFARADRIYALVPLDPKDRRRRTPHLRARRGDGRADRRLPLGARDPAEIEDALNEAAGHPAQAAARAKGQEKLI